MTCRMTHVFALGHLLGRPASTSMVDHGVASLLGRMRDQEHDGWFAKVAADGPTVTDKTAYEHAFVLLAATSAAVCDRPRGPRAARRRPRRVSSSGSGTTRPAWSSSVGPVVHRAGRLPRGEREHALGRGAAGRRRRPRRPRPCRPGARITARVVHELAAAHDWRIPEHFDSDWAPQPESTLTSRPTPSGRTARRSGHWLEWGRLAVQLARRRSAPFRAGVAGRRRRRSSTAPSGRAGRSTARPGFVYTVDWPARRWSGSGCTGSLLRRPPSPPSLHEATGREPAYASLVRRPWWQHVDGRFSRPRPRVVAPRALAHQRAERGAWAGKPDVYHAFQATLLPRLPLAPALAPALAAGLLG